MTEQFQTTAQAATAASSNIAAECRAARRSFEEARYEDALASCRRIEDLDVRNEEVPQILADIVIAQSREQAGMQTDGRLIRRLKDRPATAIQFSVKPSSTGGQPLTVIQQLEAAVRDRPSVPDVYLKLAQAYLDKDREYDAGRLLSKGREATD